MNFPDRIFAVGGAGKAIALELLESEWVLKDLLQPRPNPASLTVTIIDTAEGEENSDRQRLQRVRERINEKEAELRDTGGGRTGNIDIEYKLITEDIHLSGSIDLLGDEAVPRIAAGNGMDEENWWIKEDHINENLDFAKGVVRKRGLGKAIYYKAYAEDDQISSYIDLPEKGKVAVLAGLGGGTGSGILVDLATHLQEKQRTAEITLFGIMPNHTEGIKENTNAYAALSELEYIALNNDHVFKDRVIIPIDPTNFDGKTGNRIQTDKYLEELDEAVIYLLASYYNTQNLEDPFADAPQYAPFIIGIPQVLRYNVEAINEARERFRDVLNAKTEALQIEEEIYSRIDRFLTKHYDENEESGLRDLDRTDLKERVEEVESWLEFDLFQELEYHSIDVFENIVREAKEESNEIIEQVDIISGSIRAVDTTSKETGTFVDDIDEHLAEVLETELSLISRRKGIFERRKVIEDNRIRDAVEYLLGVGDTNAAPGVKLQRLEAKLEDVEDRYESVDETLQQTIEELEATRDEQSAEIERLTSDWIRDIEDEVSQLQNIDVQKVQSLLTTLQTQLDEFMQYVINAASETEVEQVVEQEIHETLEELASELESVGMDIGDKRRDITGSLSELKRAKKAFLLMNQEEGTIEKITPWDSSTEEERQQANKDFRIQRNNLNEKGVFQVGPPTGNFGAKLTYDVQRLVDDVVTKEQQLKESIIDSIRTRVENLPPKQQEALDTELSGDRPEIDQLREIARRVFRLEVGETEDIENRKQELEEELDELQQRKSIYEPAIELFQEVNNRREGWEEKNSEFRQELAQHDDEREQQVATQEEEYVYVKSIKPADIFRATGNENIAESDLFANEEENQRVRSNLEELAKNARNQQYTGLKRRKIAKGRSRYSDLKVRVAATSPAISQIDPEALDFEEMFRGAFDLGASGKRVESPFTSWRKDIGGAWDISLSVFISGVFLDNIRKVVQADGYHAGYKQRRQDIGDDILVHHSHGLDEGYYVRRDELLNMEANQDIAFYLQDEQEIVDDLLADYISETKVE
jgi:hypothetical protein